MNTKVVDAIAKAMLYEGYMLYPYRASSIKNRQRFNFGVLYPRSYSEAQAGSDAWSLQTEFLILGDIRPRLEVRLRFLKMVSRSLRNSSQTNEKAGVPWQEATECEVALPLCALNGLLETPVEWRFPFPAQEETETLRDTNGQITGEVIRRQERVDGVVEVQARLVTEELFKVQVRVKNLTSMDCETRECEASPPNRDEALMRSLVSAHVLLGVENGQFVSLLDPPENLKELAASCQQIGVWPVLVGNEGARDTMLASPIILYDYPQIAPESPGDLFDGTEIDEILALRILTMTDGEKQEMRQTDERSRKMLERTENLPLKDLMKLHGTLRELRPSPEISEIGFAETRAAEVSEEMP
jgi:hypothetical protein